MPIGAKGLMAFKSQGSPPMPMPAAPAMPAAQPDTGHAEPDGDQAIDTDAVMQAVSEVESGDVDPQVDTLLEGSPTEENPPSQAQDLELWKHCVQTIDPDGAGLDKYQGIDTWQVVAQLYIDLGGEIGQGAPATAPTPDQDAESDIDD